MENVVILTEQNPREKANYLSILTFAWFRKLCSKSISRNLKVSSLCKCLSSDRSHILTNKLERNWNKEVVLSGIRNVTPSLYRAITKTFFWNSFFYGLLLFFNMAILRPIGPILLAYFITLFNKSEDSNQNITNMLIAGSLMVVIMLFMIFINHHTKLELNRVGMRIRIACSSLIYRKMLRLSPQSLEQRTAGEIINLLSNDVSRFDLVTFYLHHLWIMPILTIFGTTFMWYQVGISGVVSIAILVVTAVPIYVYTGRLMSRLRLRIAEKTDKRVRQTSEIISGIQVIKIYAWEKPFVKLINCIRTEELRYLTKTGYLRGLILSASVFIERAILFITIVTYLLLGNAITAAQVFSMAQIINTLQLSIVYFFPFGINLTAETMVSIKRLQSFLLLEEKCLPKILKNDCKEVVLKNVQASWIHKTPNLENINLKLPSGCLCAVVGPVGAGKSSLLHLLLGELLQDHGKISIDGTIAYASQKPWLFTSTVKQNILFGQDYDRKLYNAVVKTCSLKKDFEDLPQGDNTFVGEKGVSLSGGQKARINLARTVYRKADIYLLDDPLSAVDAHVGNELFQNCIVDYLSNKTRILVTHQLQYLEKVDHIVVINEGKIEAQGTFAQLSEINIDFTKLVISTEEGKREHKNMSENRTSLDITDSVTTTSSMSSKWNHSANNLNHLIENDEAVLTTNASKNYWQYVRYGGSLWKIFILVLLLLSGQVFANCSDLWITFFTSQEPSVNDLPLNVSKSGGEEGPYQISKIMAIYVYTLLVGFCVVLLSCGAVYLHKMAMTSSKNLHNKMFIALIQAPTKFFDTNPSGRILNRFSKDMGVVDDILPQLAHMSIQILLIMIGILIMVFYSNPFMIPVLIFLSITFNKLRREFVIIARNVKLLEGSTKSPVFSHISSTWNGITTIRATENESLLKREFDFHQDAHTSSWYLSIVSLASFGLWLDLVSLVFFFCVVFGFILLNQFSEVSGSFVGLAISQSSILTGMVQHGISQVAQAVSQMASVERILEYTNLESEESKSLIDSDRVKLWPYQGEIKFSNVFLKYSELDSPVLNNVNFSIKPGEKVGIVGRTGAGKSSLISALFRLVPIEGAIFIDKVNIQGVSLKELRTHISIIPQEPVLFSATLRFNLDPFRKYSDEKLWKALEEVELKDIASSLNFYVNVGGSNFSVGQRQLICLARAILRKNKILVLDEATANVDSQTDNLIQNTIRKKFRNCTVLTVAHRINTIMDSDRVIVINSGKVVEFDHPHILLQNKDGYFSKMVAETNSAHLQAIAEAAYLKYKF